MRASDIGDRTDTHSFREQFENPCGLPVGNVVPPERALVRDESGVAGIPAEPLDPRLPVGSETVRSAVVTTDAGHRACLSALEARQSKFGSECGLRPRLDLPRRQVATGGGAFCYFFFFIASTGLEGSPYTIELDGKLPNIPAKALRLIIGGSGGGVSLITLP